MKITWLLLLAVFTACAPSHRPAAIAAAGVPDCMNQLIKKLQTAPKQNPPTSIYSYRYHNDIVYYVSAACCDQFSDLYDGNCTLIGHPDGGLTGKGDGLFLDFNTTKATEKLIWKDDR